MLRRSEGVPIRARAQRDRCAEERLALSHPRERLHHIALHRGVRIAQRLAVAHAHQVADDPPGEAELLRQPLERLDEPLPGRFDILLEPGEHRFESLERRADRGLDVRRLD